MAAVNVKGLRELRRLLAATNRAADKDLRVGLRALAEPIRADAEGLASSSIPRVGPNWSRMRVGVTQKLVYVAPRERGTRGRTARSRPRFADLLEQRAMTPALQRNEARLEQGVEDIFDSIAAKWNRQG